MEADRRQYRDAERMRTDGQQVGWIEYQGRRALVEVVHQDRIFLVMNDAEGESVRAEITRRGFYVGKGNTRQEAMDDLLGRLRREWESGVRERQRRERDQRLAEVAGAVKDVLADRLGSEAADDIGVTVTAIYPGEDDTVVTEPEESLPPYTPPSYHLDEVLEA